ncbi:MAG TPA: DUF1287 domain-containing protein [Acidobacteriaceae bacterium]|nr:DUF1287 domain-containing protein [Acidobacteriaceae bacterium]
MLRRDFLVGSIAAATAGARVFASPPTHTNGIKLADAAKKQVGVTTSYDPHYARIPYPGGDVPRSTGVCADVIVRAGRDALGLDLQTLVHEDMLRDFAAYPKTWHMQHPDSNIDHRRVLNLEVYWTRARACIWTASSPTAGNGFPGPLQAGDILTWRLDAREPHVGIVVENSLFSTRIVHNWGNGAEESALFTFTPHRAVGHYRWPVS